MKIFSLLLFIHPFFSFCQNQTSFPPLNIHLLLPFDTEGSRKMEHKGNSWHETCFSCQRCQQPIGTKTFIPKDNFNYCVPCYEKQFAMQCVHCKKPITTGGVTYREQPWHRECFVCTGCKQQLSGQRFTSRDDFVYCLNCFCNLHSKKCTSCSTPIGGKAATPRCTSQRPPCVSSTSEIQPRKLPHPGVLKFSCTASVLKTLFGLGGSKYISFEERHWHNDCFNCKKCAMSLIGRGFLTDRDDILCPECGKDI